MSMSVGSGDGDQGMMAEINTTPLVDIMLVLLIIFLITIPVILKVPVKIQVPKAFNIPTQTKPENINLSVNKDGDLFWNEQPVADFPALVERLKTVAVKVPQPEVHIRGDQNTRYEFVGKVVFTCQRASILKIGFITEPPPKG